MGNDEKERYEALETAVHGAMEKTGEFLKDAFKDMAESAKAQHEVDKANFEAVKAQSKANFEAAKAQSKANFEANKFPNSLAKAKEVHNK